MQVQWLRLQASTTTGLGLIPGWVTKILHATQHGQKKKEKDRQGDQFKDKATVWVNNNESLNQ